MSRSTTPRRVTRAIALAAVFALLLALPAGASDTPERIEPDEPISPPRDAPGDPEFAPELWFVEFSGEPTTRGGDVAAMAQQRNALRREAREAGVEFEQRFDFQRLWNGLSVRASASEANALAGLNEVSAVYPVELIDAPDPQDADPQLATALQMTGADVAQSELGLDGDSLSVAIVDTGIDYNHPDLGGGDDEANTITADPDDRTMDHTRITHGWDYVGEDYDAGDPDNDVPEPDDDPMDINGHGTHVAGIVGADAAAEGGATGVAPSVEFGAYKVFGAGSSSADVIIDAMEDAHEDGMDIINMSLGAGFAWGDYPTSQVANELVDENIVVVVAAGNEGTAGAFSLGAPGNASDVIGVASADNTFMDALVMEFQGQDVPYTGISSAELPPTSGTSDEIAWIGRACLSEGDALLDDPSGKTALIVRGTCTFDEKYSNAVDAGATGVLIYNNIPGLFAGGGITPVEGVWAAALTNQDGQMIQAAVEDQQGDLTLTFTERETQVANPTGGLVSSFSSYGMTPDLLMKPDVMAPGGLIRSTYPLAQDGYATISGTSMATPHVAGAVALLLQDQPDLAASDVESVLQNNAEPAAWSLAPGAGFLDHSFRQGAGMMRIDRSVEASTSVSPSELALGEAPQTTTTLQITNSGDEEVTYQLGHEGTIGTAGFGDDPWGDWATIFFPQFAGPTTSAQFSAGDTQLHRVNPSGSCTGARVKSPSSSACVTVAPGATASVGVTIQNPPLGLYAHQAGGYVTVTSETGDQHVVPYAGLAGQLSDIEIWPDERPDAVGLDNHLVAQYVDDTLTIAPDGHAFNPRRGDEPVAAVFMGFAAQSIEVSAVHESGEEFPVAAVDYARRSASPTEYLPYTWDARTEDGSFAPKGEYVFKVRALTVGADPADEDAWVEGTTSPFVLRGVGGPPGGDSDG